jgi:negative regulator of sigma E activity
MEERFERIEQRVDQHGELIAELRTSQLATNQALQMTNQNIDRLANISERFITVAVDAITELRTTTNRLDQAVEELRASNRRQEAINDYLIRRDREGGNGSRG